MKKLGKRLLGRVFLATIFLQLIGSVFYFLVLTDTGAIQLTYAASRTIMFAAPITLVLLGLSLPKFNISSEKRKSVLYGVGTGIAISTLILSVFYLFNSTFTSFAGNIADKVSDFGILKYYFLAAVGMSVVHSLFEEYFWRWYVVGGLELRMATNHAILLGGLFFAMHHYIILSQFFPIGLTLLFGTFVGVGGVIWSLIYKKTGSLLGAWISHAIVDGTLFYIGYLLIN
ncbi:CPBP family intramembrane metalloprotease [Candidatus Uhrbacteria bacterium]|nr:CPBP family intramembrane metalloprotease [Candidatus Uhrbacteria bacterium]